MSRRFRALIRFIFVVATLLACPVASFAQVKVILSGGFSAALWAVLPDFEGTTGLTVTASSGASQGSNPNTIGAQLRRGVPADVVVMNRVGLNDLITEGRIMAGTDVDLASTSLGVAVRVGRLALENDQIAIDGRVRRALGETVRRVGARASTTVIVINRRCAKYGVRCFLSRRLTTRSERRLLTV